MNVGQNPPRIDPNLNLNLIQGLNINVAAQNPHEAEMREQFALQQMAAQANKEGAEKVNNAFQDFAEETRKNYAAVAERCKQLEEKLVTQEAEAKIEKEVLLNALKESAKAIELLTIQSNNTNLKLADLENKFEKHRHIKAYDVLVKTRHSRFGTPVWKNDPSYTEGPTY